MNQSVGTARNLQALLIGIDCYLDNNINGDTYPSLQGCVRDIDHVDQFLRTKLGIPNSQIWKLRSTHTGTAEPPDSHPTYENMVTAFQRLQEQAQSGDQIYIHYSGHGGRTPTLLPDLKGPAALDETLVPMDIGNSAARYLRDVELACLLKLMTDKGLVVTIVLDCCHSGGATRGIDAVTRGVSFVDETRRPTESLAASREALRSVWQRLIGRSARSLSTVSQPPGYTLLAACRPHEWAYEYAFDGHGSNGVLTYWLLDTLQQMSPDLTFKRIYDRVLTKVHSQFRLQTPLLQGDPHRLVFGTGRAQTGFAVRVLTVDMAAGRAALATGQAAGMRKGAQFVTYPRSTADFIYTDRRTALLEIDQLGATESRARIIQIFGNKTIEDGDEALLIGAPSMKLVRKIRLLRPNGEPTTAADTTLQRVRQALAGNGWVVHTVSPDEASDFCVTTSEDGAVYQITDAAGQPWNLRPPLWTRDSAAADIVVRRLVHLAKFKAIENLENNDPCSHLRGKLNVELLSLPDDFAWGDRPDPKPFPQPFDAIPTLHTGQWVCLRIANTSSQVINLTLLDLQPDWGVSQAFPTEDQNLDFEPLEPGQAPLLIPLYTDLPDAYEAGEDILKIIATVGATSFRMLTLPSLDQPMTSKIQSRSPRDALEQLLSAVTADRPTSRTLTPLDAPSREWVVETLRVQIRRSEFGV